jgi:mRNA export factor
MSFGAPVAPAPQLIGSCTSGTTDRLAPQDHCVQSAGNDGISSLRWSPTNHLLSTNWDGGVRCWEVQEQGGQIHALPKAQGESLFA